jgi:Ni,Fe-hydrogenase III small subunit
MPTLFQKIFKTGIVTEPLAPGDDEMHDLVRAVDARAKRLFGRALAIREVDAGSCNGCEIEITGLTSPVYDSERFGIHFVASPRHADLLLVTGPVTRNMEVPLRKTYEATPDPKLVVAVGDCARTCGVFAGSYAVAGSVDQIIPVDVFVPGCPPEPAAILCGILAALDRLPKR